jgi:two-component system, NtrC family, response regulator HydG
MSQGPSNRGPRVLVVDDDFPIGRAVERILRGANFEVVAFTSSDQALNYVRTNPQLDAVLSDLHLGPMTGLEMLKEMRDSWPTVPAVIMTGKGTIESAVQAMRYGVYDYLVKPFEQKEGPIIALRRAIEHHRLVERNRFLQEKVDLSDRFDDIVGSSAELQEVFQVIASVAPADTTTLVVGESGTGKELVARAIHQHSRRSARPFVAVNCGALTETVLESELFGHTKGAFTGAVAARRGLFEEADGGTLFLDEVGELSPGMQVSLLRVLQERSIRPVGANVARAVDVRVVAATHRDLEQAVEQGTMREDLFYRLNVVSVELPSLRKRRDDIPLLAHHFLRKHHKRLGRPVDSIDDDVMVILCGYDWPGNVRELENTIERGVVLSQSTSISVNVLPPKLKRKVAPRGAEDAPLRPFVEAKRDFESRYLRRVLDEAEQNIGAAARLASMDRSNFRRMMKRLGIIEGG